MDKRGKIRAVVLALLAILGIICFFYDAQLSVSAVSLQNSAITALLSPFEKIYAVILFSFLAVFLFLGKYRKADAFPLALSLIVSTFIAFILKIIIMRPRPLGLIEYFPIINLVDSSFPSAHAMVVFSILPLLEGKKELRILRYAWIIFAVIIALSRPYLRVHYFSDIIFGGIFGYLVGLGVIKLKEKYF